MKLHSQKSGGVFALARLLFASALLIVALAPSWASAQSSSDPWTEPLNVSHAGMALNPSFVMDSDGIGHAIWQDESAEYFYSRFDGAEWSVPKITGLARLFQLPATTPSTVYTGPNPLLLAGPQQNVFAFWLSPEGELFRSKVKGPNFGNASGWESGRMISSEAASFATVVDPLGELHLVYLRTVEDPAHPAGIYYTRSMSGGANWAVPVLLYQSPYLRTVAEGEAHLSVATALIEDALHVYVAWDNLPRKQVFLAQSADGGTTWGEPARVAGPSPDSGDSGPFNISVGANQSSVVLIWQNGRVTNGLLPACNQVYQSSSDGGVTWNEPQPMMEDISGCALSNEYLAALTNDAEDTLYLLTKTKGEVFLTAWNGDQWSQPQEQTILSGFQEPEIFTQVMYGCHRASVFAERLYIVGCDQGEGGDAWFTSRELGSFEPPVWSQLRPVISDNQELEAVELVSTADGIFHAFYSQHLDPAIYYTYWDGDLWSRAAAVLDLPEGQSAWPAIAAGPGNELFLLARNDSGALFFSRATSGDAATESRWSKPVRLETGNDGEIGSADIAWAADGTLYVVYSVPVNEQRGIYVIHSEDKGTSWSAPLQVFNGSAAGFDLIGVPSLLVAENGSVHIIWKQQSIQGDGVSQPLSLYYTRSDDGGQTFNEAQLVVDEPVDWRELVTDGEGNLHLLWQPHDTLTVWDQVSLDSGKTWQYPQGLPNEGSLSAVTKDSAGRLHLVGVGLSALGHWVWDSSRWQTEEHLGWTPSSQKESPVELLAAAISNEGTMMAVVAKSADQGDASERTLLYATRGLESSLAGSPEQKDPTPTSLPPTLTVVTPTSAAEATPTLAVATAPTTLSVATGSPATTDRLSPFKIALVPVGLLLLSVLGLVLWQAARAKDR